MPKKWLKEKCVFCSLCTATCPYGAFQSNEEVIEYIPSQCIECESYPPSIG